MNVPENDAGTAGYFTGHILTGMTGVFAEAAGGLGAGAVLKTGGREVAERVAGEVVEEAGERAASGSLREGLRGTTNMTPPSQVRTPTPRPEAPRIQNPALRNARNEIQDNRVVDQQQAGALEAATGPGERAGFWENLGDAIKELFN